MAYKYIDLDKPPHRNSGLIYFQDGMTRSHMAHVVNNIPLYRYGPKNCEVSYWIPKWYNRLLACLDFCTSPKGDSFRPDIEATVFAASYIWHNKALRHKWSSVLTLDEDYLKLPYAQSHRELHKDLELAGHKHFGCYVPGEEHNGL